MKMNISNCKLINEFSKVKILVIGELMLDIYLKGYSSRISPEAPVPVVNITDEISLIGGAANVAINLKSLGAKVLFCSVCGQDSGAFRALEMLKENGVNTNFVFQDKERATLLKERVMVQNQMITRFDKGSETNLSEKTEKILVRLLEHAYFQCDAVIIADYNKGILTPKVKGILRTLRKKKRQFLAIDSKTLKDYKELYPDVVKPNYREAAGLLKIPLIKSDRTAQIRNHGKKLASITGAALNVVTLDEDGALVFQKENLAHQTTAIQVKDPNVVGAGDTFLSAFSLALICKANIQKAAEIACTASAIAIKKENTSNCTALELRSYFAFKNKYISGLQELKDICEIYRDQKKKIVFTNGCFDILHCGHVNFLKASGLLGDIQIVGINNDSSIKRLKGSGRPVNPLADRMAVIAGLTSVNHIISFGEKNDDSPSQLIKIIKPDIFVKGGDYTREMLPESSLVEKQGGIIRFLPLTPNHSTTAVIRRIQKSRLLSR